MLLRQPQSLLYLFLLSVITIMATGCYTVKKYPPHQPFVFKTDINIQGNLPAEEKANLESRLENQLDDSLRLKVVTPFPLVQKLVKPPVFDTAAANRTIGFMNNLLYSLGYYKATIEWDSTITITKDKQAVNVSFTVTPGKSYRFDSIAYTIEDSVLLQLALASRSNSLVKKGAPYSVEIISAELDRLVEVYKNNGYYKISKEDLQAERDTVIAALINPNLDPFEQLQLLQEARKRQENPTMNLIFRLREGISPAHLKKYYIRNVSIYPDLDLLQDTTVTNLNYAATNNINGIIVNSIYNKFKPGFVVSRSTLKPGNLYRQNDYIKTYTNYTQLGAWSQVNIELMETADSTQQLDVEIKMFPGKKQDVNFTVDGSYNTADIISTGNLFGVGLNFGLNNRNVAKQAILSSTNLRTGIELGKGFIQTQQVSLQHIINFPKLILPFKVSTKDSLTAYRTQLNFNAGYTNRKDFFELRSLNASWGYGWVKKKHTLFYSPLNVEFVRLTRKKKLEDLIDSIPNLAYSFNDGLIISQIFGYTYNNSFGKRSVALRLGLEESGGIFGFIKGLDTKANLSRFVKLDADLRYYINHPKSTWAFRLYGGTGIPLGRDIVGAKEKTLPFFKSFYAGGPYSMRAWSIRQLGIGSSRYFEDSLKGNDRFGDVQLEGNIEYRFNVGSFFGIKIKSAFFADMGNIWFRTDYGSSTLKNTDFKLSRLYKDLAVAGGTSLRADFDYFLIRFDWAYKIKNPIYSDINAGWFHGLQLFKGQFQLGINYPF
jgi:outer membrane protein insertion porin family